MQHRRADVAGDHGRVAHAATTAEAVSAMAAAGLGGYPDPRFAVIGRPAAGFRPAHPPATPVGGRSPSGSNA